MTPLGFIIGMYFSIGIVLAGTFACVVLCDCVEEESRDRGHGESYDNLRNNLISMSFVIALLWCPMAIEYLAARKPKSSHTPNP